MSLFRNSEKMLILNMLFVNMKEKGSWVLIFSQMSRASDVLEDYCLYSELRSLFFSLPFLLDVECIRIY